MNSHTGQAGAVTKLLQYDCTVLCVGCWTVIFIPINILPCVYASPGRLVQLVQALQSSRFQANLVTLILVFLAHFTVVEVSHRVICV